VKLFFCFFPAASTGANHVHGSTQAASTWFTTERRTKIEGLKFNYHRHQLGGHLAHGEISPVVQVSQIPSQNDINSSNKKARVLITVLRNRGTHIAD